ncbi:MAG: amino acid ABC transporter substrate-binding protein [Burkholderiales bacterium]|nr:amino acid ABC transporter substrate-binding protein [Burkholderiales bacterium]
MYRSCTFALALLAAFPALAQNLDGRLKRIAESKTIIIAHRVDAAPFSFVDDSKAVVGFSIDLCKRVADLIGNQVSVKDLKIKWLPVTSLNRFDAIAKGQADMECGSSTVTLSRLKQVDFSSFIFLETTGLMTKAGSGLRSLSDMSGKKIAVIGGTTNARAINELLKARQVSAAVVPFKYRDDAFAALEEGRVDAFASDRLLLIGSAVKAKDPRAFDLLPDQLSFEPYGIALPRGDANFRLAVNSGLAHIYRSGEIVDIFGRWFRELGPPGPVIETLYMLGAIPE